MSSIDKVKVGDTTYDVSPGSSGILNGYTSNDNVTPPAWSDVSAIASTDTNSGIFGKLTSMVRNVRWLYNKLGTTDFSNVGGGTVTGALSSLQTELSGKADSTHSHTTGDLPVTNSLSTNSASYIPSSSAVYSLQSIINDLNTEITNLSDQVLDPNKMYESRSLGTWSSVSDVDTFLSQYTHENRYSGLQLGNYVTIQDGTYNIQWQIAGFDMEHNQTAASGTTYDNGYGICLIPKDMQYSSNWGSNNSIIAGAYKSASIRTTLGRISGQLRSAVLGDHLINRNVLLSDSVDTNGKSYSYTWLTYTVELMSIGQITGSFGINMNKYDDGEANYKMPIFDYKPFTDNYGNTWTRNIYGALPASYNGGYGAWYVHTSGSIYKNPIKNSINYLPMIYIR